MELDDGRLFGDQPGDDDAIRIVKDAISNLPQQDRDIYQRILRDCELHGRSIRLKTLPTERRFNIARALLTLLKTGEYHDDLVLALTRHITGKPHTTISQALASLTVQQSRTFAWLAMLLVQGSVELQYHPETNTFGIKEEINV